MKRILIYGLLALLITSCSHRIARSGYKKQTVPAECEVVIQKDLSLPDTVATMVGGITLGESGISVNCNEATAMETLKKEACSASADLVLITQEKRPDVWSSCYRCKAEFYRFNNQEDKAIYTNHTSYQAIDIKNRVKNDRNKNLGMFMGAVAVGFLTGFLFL